VTQEPERLVFMAFDLLHLNRSDLRPLPLIERRHALAELVSCDDPSCRIQHSEHVVGGGNSRYARAKSCYAHPPSNLRSLVDPRQAKG
jgi:ATP-dependent DNA ligase